LSAHLLNDWTNRDNYTNTTNIYNLYNPGDVPADFELIIPFKDCIKINELQLVETESGYSEHLYIDFTNISKKT
jgi:hypothetical protein